MRRRKRYVCKAEIKFAEQIPADGQSIAFRAHGHKTYYRGIWDAEGQQVVSGESRIAKRYLMGWLPLKKQEESV